MPATCSIRRLCAVILLGAGLSTAAVVKAESTQESMRLVYAALSELLPAALDEGGFDSADSIERMEAALDVLERSAHTLAGHGGGSSAEFAGLARSFESNIVLLRQSLDFGRYNEFSYLVLDLTHNCASCHARLPSGSGPSFASELVDAVRSQLYTRVDLAQLQIATRQFDAAMSTLEGIIDDPETEPLDLELDGVLFDYLSVGIGVVAQPARVIDTLSRLRARSDVPYYIARYAGQWSEHIGALEGDMTAPASLDRVRELFDAALRLSPIPSSQVRVVYDLVVSSMLRRLIEDGGLDAAARAESYWMLGVISIRTVNPRPGVPHTELLLDAAIRAAPGSDYAKRCYALLEEYNRVSFAGIPTAELPEPVLNMDELRELAGIPGSR